MKKPIILCLLLAILGISCSTTAQQSKLSPSQNTKTTYDDKLLNTLQWREIGPFRGGRSCAVTGVKGKPNLFYMGATGGGVWRTTDGGKVWENISDGFFGGSIGTVSVSESDNNVIYVGGGEETIRGNVSYGYGVWKSVDAGKTWAYMGLKDTRHISRIRIHPNNPDIVYVAAMGNAFASGAERGVYKSEDGGKNWRKVLFANDFAGAVDLNLDPNNPRIMYASTWRFRRAPYYFSSGGDGSALWKSTDAGETWKDISKNEGLPKDTLGIIGVAVSPLNSNRVYAQIEAKNGGLFRSDDAGKTWKKMNEDRNLRQRAWYYTRVYADTKDEDVVYVLNVSYGKSKDGGKTFTYQNAPHGDHHDLWIAPEDANRMIMADDGGAQVSFDGGDTWSTYHNQPTAQYYRVTTDNSFPYRILVAQQDNSTIRVKHRTDGGSIGERDWEETAGSESATLAADPTNPDIVYGGSYDGYLTRLDHKTGEERSIDVYPDNPMGSGAEGMKYRFQWNFPVFFSPHNPKKLYVGSNHLHATTNEGQSWELVSPDLTRNEPTKLKSSGGPITQDNTSVEYYCTIFAAAESPKQAGLIWTGSDDGLVQLTKDGGKTWTNVTPKNMPEWIQINSIEPDPNDAAVCYFAATNYKNGDFRPYLYKTKDYGQTWTKIVNGIDNEHFTRVIRIDPNKKGLLVAGTETGMYISFDDGENWQKFQMNLPIVPITDLTFKDNNLIAATQGRSLWIIDDVTVLHQLNPTLAQKEHILFQPMPSYRMKGFGGSRSKTEGTNRPNGVMTHFYLKTLGEKDTVKLAYYEDNGKLIREYSNFAKEDKDKMKVKEGGNMYSWDLSYPDGKKFDGLIMWAASLRGAKAIPNTNYNVKLFVNGKEAGNQSFKITKDPRITTSDADYKAQFDFVTEVQTKVNEMHQTIIDIRDIRTQLDNYKNRIGDKKDFKPLMEKAEALNKSITEVEETLYQTKLKSGQDALNFPIRLNNKLAALAGQALMSDSRPTDGMIQVKNDLLEKINPALKKFEAIKNTDLPAFNKAVKAMEVDAILLKK